MRPLPATLAASLALTACDQTPKQDASRAQGPNPELAEPHQKAIPTVNVARGEGWPAGAMPTVAAGLSVNEFAGDLAHPRWLLVLPNGDVLAAETDNPGTDKSGGSIKGKIQKLLMKKA